MADILDDTPMTEPLYKTAVWDTRAEHGTLGGPGLAAYAGQPGGAPYAGAGGRVGYRTDMMGGQWFDASSSPYSRTATNAAPPPPMFGGTGNIRSEVWFPSLGSGNGRQDADMMVKRQLDIMKSAAFSQDPSMSGLTLDDMDNLRTGYRNLKGSGWDPREAASAALALNSAYGSYSDFSNRAERLRDRAFQQGSTVSDVARKIGKFRAGFLDQYKIDSGFVNGSVPNAIDMADMNDMFSGAMSAIYDVEDRFNYSFDDKTYKAVLHKVSQTAATLSRYGMSPDEIGMDKIVESAMYDSGAMRGGNRPDNVLSKLVRAQKDDAHGLTWSDFDFDDKDVRAPDPQQSQLTGFNVQPGGRSGKTSREPNDNDFMMSRGIREAMMRHRVRNIRNGLSVDDFSDTSILRQEMVDSLRANSIVSDGLTDGDFGQLADAIISKRANGQRVSITGALKEMLYAPAGGLSSDDQRRYARQVTGAWGSHFSQLLNGFQTGKLFGTAGGVYDPTSAETSLKSFADSVRTSGMSEDAQNMVIQMTDRFMRHHGKKAQDNLNEAADDDGHTRPQRFKHRATQLAQAVQLVSMIDACRQAGVISDADAAEMNGKIWDEKEPGKINLGVLHTVEGGFLHHTGKDTRSNWLLQTDRTFNGVSAFADTKVREKNSDPLEYIFNRLNDAMSTADVPGLGSMKDQVAATVDAMNKLRAVYDGIEKDSNGYLRSSHVLTMDDSVSKLRTREDISAGAVFGITIPGWLGGEYMPDWLSGRGRLRFDKRMKDYNIAMNRLRGLSEKGFVVPGMEEGGFDDKYASASLVGRWDSPEQASLRVGKDLNGTLLYGVDQDKADAWAKWSRNQTMDTVNGQNMVDVAARSMVANQMKKFPGVSQSDPRYTEALRRMRRYVRNQYIAGSGVAGLAELDQLSSELGELTVAGANKPNNGRNGKTMYGRDHQIMQEIDSVLAPLQMAGDREFTALQQREAEQQLIAANQLRLAEERAEAQRTAVANEVNPDSGLTKDQQALLEEAEKTYGRPLSSDERSEILRRGEVVTKGPPRAPVAKRSPRSTQRDRS